MEPDQDPTIADPVIDNEVYAYGIHGFMSVTDTSNPDLRFYGCLISYIP